MLMFAFLENDKGINLENNYKDKIEKAILDLDKNAQTKNIPKEKFEYIKYALIALIDEIIINSTWSYKHYWIAHSLQLKYFKEHTAGEVFFEKISIIRQKIELIDVLEVYYICLQLGFLGMYRFHKFEEFLLLKKNLYEQIKDIRKEEIKLSPLCSIPKNSNFQKKIPIKGYFKKIIIFFGIFFVVYLSFYLFITAKSDSALNRIKNYKTELKQNQIFSEELSNYDKT